MQTGGRGVVLYFILCGHCTKIHWVPGTLNCSRTEENALVWVNIRVVYGVLLSINFSSKFCNNVLSFSRALKMKIARGYF